MKFLAVVATLVASVALGVGPNGIQSSLTVQNAAGNSGSCTSLSCSQMSLQVPMNGAFFAGPDAKQNTASIQVSGTWSGTISFQYSQDEQQTWLTLPCNPVNTATTNLTPLANTSTTVNGNWVCDIGGMTGIRAVMSTYSSGTAVVNLEQYVSIGYDSISSMPLVTDTQQRIVQGASSGATYNFTAAVTVPTAAADLIQIVAPDAGLSSQQRAYLRELDVCLDPAAVQTTAGPRKLILYATTATETSGTYLTASINALDPASAAYTGGSYKGATTTPAIGSVTEANALDEFTIFMPAAATALNPNQCVYRKYDGTQGQQPIAFGGCNGAACVLSSYADAGVALGDLTGGSGGTGNYIITTKISAEPK
jgi:hypothetical protein